MSPATLSSNMGSMPIKVPENSSLEEAWLSSNFTFRWLTRLNTWGIKKEDYDEIKRRTKGIPDEDVLYLLYKKVLVKHKKEPLLLQSLYYEMAMMAAELGKSSKESLSLAHKIILEHYKKINVKFVVIENSGKDSCPSCKKLDGWMLMLPGAAKKKTLPNSRCTKKHGKSIFCRCTYGPIKE